MAELNFKYGLYENLDGVGISNGTLYITTDEKRIYADLDGKRIDLGQIVVLDTFDWKAEGQTPPSSPSAFYYVVDTNEFLKYDSAKGWRKINDTTALEEAVEANAASIEKLNEIVGFYPEGADSAQIGNIIEDSDGTLKVCVSINDQGEPVYEPASNISARIEALKAKIAEVEQASGKDVSGLVEEVERLAGLIEDEASGLAPTKEIADKATEDISNIKNGTNINDFAGVEAAFDSLDETYATDEQVAQAVAAARGETAETVASVDAKAVANAEAIEELDKKLTAELQAADALIYKGTIAQASDLPTSEVKKGWTYKVSADILKTDFAGITINWATTGEQPKDEYYVRAGDILIATGEEDVETGFITSVEWDHVPAGYNADYVPVMSVASETANAVDIKLTSAHAADGEAGDLGSIQFAGAEDSAVSVALNDNKVTIGLTWGTF